jgi:hypothetical protein
MPFHKAFYALERLDEHHRDDAGYVFRDYIKFFISIENEKERLVKIRNESRVAHGMKPVKFLDARDSIPLARDVLTTLIPDTAALLNNYPFTPEKIVNLVDILLA